MQHFSAIWKFRYFLLSLVRLDLRLRYRRSTFGIWWSFLNPIAMTIVFVVMFSTLLGADPRTYTTFLLLGMAVWGFLRECAVTGCHALMSHEAYIRQSSLPYGLYSLRIVLGQAIHSCIGLGVALAAVVVVRESTAPLKMLWAVFPSLLLLLVIGWALATVFAFVNVYFNDTPHLLEIGTQLLFFLTPIIYGPEVLVANRMGWLARLNPVNLFLELIRTPFLTGEPPAAKLYLYAVFLTVGMVGLAALTIDRLQKRAIFRL